MPGWNKQGIKNRVRSRCSIDSQQLPHSQVIVAVVRLPSLSTWGFSHSARESKHSVNHHTGIVITRNDYFNIRNHEVEILWRNGHLVVRIYAIGVKDPYYNLQGKLNSAFLKLTMIISLWILRSTLYWKAQSVWQKGILHTEFPAISCS